MPSHTTVAETVSTAASAPSAKSPTLPLKKPDESFSKARKKILERGTN